LIQKGGVIVLVELINDEEDDELSNKAYEVMNLEFKIYSVLIPWEV
jgi:hypothetical protein